MNQMTDLSFLSKIPDQCGYLVLQDGSILKSDGDLANAERLASVVQKIVQVGTSDSLVGGETFNENNRSLVPTSRFFVVKRKNSSAAGSGGSKTTPES